MRELKEKMTQTDEDAKNMVKSTRDLHQAFYRYSIALSICLTV